jgi:hypothetical protein
MIRRRGVVTGAPASSHARPAIEAGTQSLFIVPRARLNGVDPIRSTSQVSRDLGFMLFEPR